MQMAEGCGYFVKIILEIFRIETRLNYVEAKQIGRNLFRKQDMEATFLYILKNFPSNKSRFINNVRNMQETI